MYGKRKQRDEGSENIPERAQKKACGVLRVSQCESEGSMGCNGPFFPPFPCLLAGAAQRQKLNEIRLNQAVASMKEGPRRALTRARASNTETNHVRLEAKSFSSWLYLHTESACIVHTIPKIHIWREGRVGRKCITTRPTFECCFFFYRALVLRRE